MPSVGGVSNNPSGVNSWEGIGTEVPYGEATKQKQLAQQAPLAGGQVAAGAINAPKNAQRATQQPQQPPQPEMHPMPPPDMVPGIPTPPDPAAIWREIAATPGADRYPILQLMAQRSAP